MEKAKDNNSALAALDLFVTNHSDEPDKQLGLLMMAQVLAFRRLLVKHNIIDRGRRIKLVKVAVAEFDKRLRKYTTKENPS